jgi:hypothetical protein
VTVIVRDSPRLTFHTDLREVVAALDGVHRDHLWFLSDIEAAPLGDAPLPVEFEWDAAVGGTHDHWVTGERFDEIARRHRLQLIWGVLSGFPRDTPLAGNDLEPRPTAEPWDQRTRHPDAEIELVAFDSTFTAITAREPQVEEAFRRYFLAA